MGTSTGVMTVIQIDLANNIISIVVGIIAILTVLIGIVAWFIRLESEVKYLKKDHNDHKTETKIKEAAFEGKVEAFQKTMNDVLQGLGKIEGKLESRDAR